MKCKNILKLTRVFFASDSRFTESARQNQSFKIGIYLEYYHILAIVPFEEIRYHIAHSYKNAKIHIVPTTIGS